MGTRGSYGFRINGQDKVTYNHFDSYPTGLGIEILGFIKSVSDEEMAEIADRIVLVKSDSIPTDEQIKECRLFLNTNVGNQDDKEWYCLLREAQGKLSVYRSPEMEKADIKSDTAFDYQPVTKNPQSIDRPGLRYMIDSHTFLLDSLFCEWAYICNIDTQELEIYTGFNRKKGGAGRYASQQEPPEIDRNGKKKISEFYGVALFKTIPFEDVREINVQEYCEKLEKEVNDAIEAEDKKK